MTHQPLRLRIEWLQPGAPTDPTVFIFTGFGHQVDLWNPLIARGFRVGVVSFPLAYPPEQIWQPRQLASQIAEYWAAASVRILVGFSFGTAGVTKVADVLFEQALFDVAGLQPPTFIAVVAPVQWATLPWTALHKVPLELRRKIIRRVARRPPKLLRLLGNLTGSGIRQFLYLIERHDGWEKVSYYLPYLEWIDSSASTYRKWTSYPCKMHVFAAASDRVIPLRGLLNVFADSDQLDFTVVDGNHGQAVKSALPFLREKLAPFRENKS